jgi:hypothetical protein
MGAPMERALNEAFTNLPHVSWFEWLIFSRHGYYIGSNWSAFLRAFRWALSAVDFTVTYTLPTGHPSTWSDDECKQFFRAHVGFETKFQSDNGDMKPKGVRRLRVEIAERIDTCHQKPELPHQSIIHLVDNLHALAAAYHVRVLTPEAIVHLRRCAKCFLNAQKAFEEEHPGPEPVPPAFTTRPNYGQLPLLADHLTETNHSTHRRDFMYVVLRCLGCVAKVLYLQSVAFN